MRGLAKAHALGGTGLRGLGNVDFCDSGWSAFGAILGAAGGVITGAAGTGEDRDAGVAAAGTGMSTLSSVWGTQCTNQAAAAGVEAQREFDQQLAQQRLNNEMAIAQARMQNEMALASRQQQGGSAIAGLDNQTLLIGAGVVGAVILGALLLRR